MSYSTIFQETEEELNQSDIVNQVLVSIIHSKEEQRQILEELELKDINDFNQYRVGGFKTINNLLRPYMLWLPTLCKMIQL
ncbi:hypothetical protein TTHERM_00708500 (macronuclear) [Tetrahymena thermophila SB210]|uniref:Uncharacterized protein n=1 Tax=Tetrahymena thermophila (strain SB210) TaxID=312017 RepID=I7M0Q4_TETTS|nr:hypothetical protein TTHERM_00708500 [Tetrahymena thermophila SB210]EAR90737.1 hypothetical protein TTHERM_00708500 [Tetrahymena thermophila SB210]|eukprot:XP_001010982.1 hypothetical protein TTHERM_00708500 [Tetrahymena thermophila SB210]